MKQYGIMVWSLAFVLALLTGCGGGSTGEEKSFQATVLEVNDSSALVEALEDEEVRNSSDQFSFGTENLDDIGAEAGDIVRVLYTGGIMETYPAQIQAVSWSVVRKASDISGDNSDGDSSGKGGGSDAENDSEALPKEESPADTAIPARESACDEIVFTVSEQVGPGGGSFEMAYTDGARDVLWYYDEFFTLERFEDGEWKELPMEGGLCGMTSYMEISKESPEELKLNWSYLYGPLEPGIYCVTKEIFPRKEVKSDGQEEQAVMQEQDCFAGELPDTEAGVPVYAVFELKEGLGLSLRVRTASPDGLTLEFVRDGGNPTGELLYGSSYWLQRLENDRWCAVEYADPNQEIGWTEEGYNIPETGSEQQIDWGWLYGSLPSGQYRICKDVMDFRESGDYDQYFYTAEFEIP